MTAFRAACIQLNSSLDMRENLARTAALIRQAAGAGANLVATPENTGLMAPDRTTKLALCRREDDDPVLAGLRRLADELKIWLLIGSLAIKVRADKTHNRAFLIDPSGAVAARYDKIHLFDVALSSDEAYRESESVEPGAKAVLAELPWGKLGLSICYDIRFPHLYRRLAKHGAFGFAVPAAFTETTGAAHWHVLVRARAIENGAFVLAPAQCGAHPGGRRTYGHSLIVSPWGEVLADAGTVEGYVLADIDPAAAETARSRLPSLRHDRDFA